MSAFEKLPREIRDIIYELCLCVDEILIPYPDPWEIDFTLEFKPPQPEVALLALNRQIREEALPILFGKNTWRITAREVDLAEDEASSFRAEKLVMHRYGLHVQKIDLYYSRTPHPPESFEDVIYHAHGLSPDDTPQDRSAKADTIPDHIPIGLKKGWVFIADALDCCPNIKSIHIDIGHLATACECYDTKVQKCTNVSLGGIGCNKDCCEANTKTPLGSRNASYLCDRKTAWVGGQKREAMRKEEGSGLITY